MNADQLLNDLIVLIDDLMSATHAWLTSPDFYIQLIAVAVAVTLACVVTMWLKARVTGMTIAPEPGPMRPLREFLYHTRNLLLPVLVTLALGIAASIVAAWAGQPWLIQIAQSVAVIWLLYTLVAGFVQWALIRVLLMWIGIPLATLLVFGWLDEFTAYLAGISINIGDLEISVLVVGRTIFFGAILFWLGRISNSAGKRAIRSRQNLDLGTREVVAKLFEIVLVAVVFLLLLQVMGIDLTALAVLGGALAIGLGFGMQSIVGNYIAGLIILTDRSITLNDYIELEDGRAGKLRSLNMRCAILETFDGKDIVVPNQTFIASAFTNWTHFNNKQRYSLTFSVAYDTDLAGMIDIVNDVVRKHPQVLSGPDLPEEENAEAEIESFGDSAVNILVEFWMEGIDDGVNSVGAELNLMIWTVLNEHGIEMPFPQREVKILNPAETV